MKQKQLPVLPPMRCDDNCGECCRAFFVPEAEYQGIRRYVREHQIPTRVLPEDPYQCPFYDGTCSIYDVRPQVCRAMGHVPELRCPRGYNVNVADPNEVHAVFRSRGVAVRLLHELANEQVPGSVNLEDVKRYVCETNPSHLRRIPDRKA